MAGRLRHGGRGRRHPGRGRHGLPHRLLQQGVHRDRRAAAMGGRAPGPGGTNHELPGGFLNAAAVHERDAHHGPHAAEPSFGHPGGLVQRNDHRCALVRFQRLSAPGPGPGLSDHASEHDQFLLQQRVCPCGRRNRGGERKGFSGIHAGAYFRAPGHGQLLVPVRQGLDFQPPGAVVCRRAAPG